MAQVLEERLSLTDGHARVIVLNLTNVIRGQKWEQTERELSFLITSLGLPLEMR